MAPRLGFFDDFKGADTVLLAVTGQEAGELANQLQLFASSSRTSTEIVAEQIPGHEAKLVAVSSPNAETSGFRWLCGRSEIADIAAKLTALASAVNGHQYFDLLGSEVRLIIAVGEYAY